MATGALFLYLFQASGQAVPHAGLSNVDCGGQVWCGDFGLSVDRAPQRDAQYEEQELLRRFNGLAAALTEFSHTYNSRGVVDAKKIKAIRKAMRELEKSTWFNQKNERRESR
jgi:hypothetical protein